jgi:uncharacterized repeat protein (TIGR02543 family)
MQAKGEMQMKKKKKIVDVRSAVKATLGSFACLLALITAPALVQAQVTLFGTPSNFDVLNDTGQDAHGFEIELDGIQPADLAGVWTATRFPYTIVTTATGIVIHYASPYVNNAYTITTVVPAVFAPTLGHSCVLGAIAGCEHYGYYFAYNARRPTNVINRWLVDDPQNPGTLIPSPSGVVQIPIPTVSLIPAAQPGAAPAIVFEIPVPPPPPIPKPELQYGDAKWVKILKNEAQHAVIVDDLLEDNPVVPNDGNPGQVETAWKLLQFNPHSPNSGVMHSQANLGQGSKAVIRKYEFYKYSGPLDPATQKALCGGDGLCTQPLPGEMGDYIGTQMAAANLGISSVTVVKAGTGSGSVSGPGINCGSSCTAPIALGTAVSLTVKPASNSTFSGWTGDCVGTSLTCTFNVTAENTVTANFAAAAAGGGGGGGGGGTSGFKLTVSKNGKGTVVTNPTAASYASGTVVTLTATPDAGQPWIGWSGACSGTSTTCTLTMTADKAVTANFR